MSRRSSKAPSASGGAAVGRGELQQRAVIGDGRRVAQRGILERCEEVRKPMMDRVGAQLRHHRGPALPPLEDRHRERACQRAGDSVDVIRIDQQRGVELVGRAGELRQHQHAGIVRILSRDIFLRHQVHAVVQRRDDADMRRTVESRQHVMAVALAEIADRRPVRLAVAAVDGGHQRREVGLQPAIRVDRIARRRRDLQQRDRALQRRDWLPADGRTH